MLWWMLSAMAADPSVVVRWRDAAGELSVAGPPGEHVAPEAPYALDLAIGGRAIAREGDGAELGVGLALGDVRGQTLDGELKLSLCEDGGSRCRILELRISGAVPAGRRGSVQLVVSPPGANDNELPFPAQIDADAAWSAGQAEARRRGTPILLDFGAVWCPPCNLLSAELLDATPRPPEIAGVVVVAVDVDDPSSWALKDRYHVGGYPTVLLVDAEGAELGRQVGYPGREATLAWLRDARKAPTEPTTPADAARHAWQAVREQREDDARRLLVMAAREPELVELRLARFNLDPSAADALWLAERAPGHALEWVPSGSELAEADPAVRGALLSAIARDVSSARPLDAADLLAIAGELQTGVTAQTSYAAAAALVSSQLTGDARLDKGHYGWLAWLYEHAGQLELALTTLERARAAWPDEPTFHAALAEMMLRQERPADALVAAEQAMDHSWGDNLLTSALLKVRALQALGRRDEARAFVDKLLAETPVPSDEVEVRTHRYTRQLRAAVGE
jgi:thiol-disulfide isomerase/thioredoxin